MFFLLFLTPPPLLGGMELVVVRSATFTPSQIFIRDDVVGEPTGVIQVTPVAFFLTSPPWQILQHYTSMVHSTPENEGIIREYSFQFYYNLFLMR